MRRLRTLQRTRESIGHKSASTLESESQSMPVHIRDQITLHHPLAPLLPHSQLLSRDGSRVW